MSLKQNKCKTNRKITSSYAYNATATKTNDIPQKGLMIQHTVYLE